MPSVGMRRTTRVFGVVKGVDGARVLRSGRRLWPDFTEPKLRRPNDGDDWYPHHPHPVIKKHNGPGSGGLKPKTPNGWAHVQSMKQDEEEQVVETCQEEDEVIEEVSKKVKGEEEEEKEEEVVVSKDRMFGLVYSRKRKQNGGGKKSQDRMYGIRFSRRRRKTDGASVGTFGVVFECSCSSSGSGSGFLSLVLGCMKKERVQLPELASFLLSQPISGVFASRGIHFLWVCF